ncbi:MAG TPA: HDOD domain-containing protein [Opitutaceae bacterium]|jgi:HD-like signal output (HDOD) protein|nr:HDOD domain-containing protein [Opitutaceae bacterium]HRE04538.1 HDOD domain-containing protein [Opitutaceae bacterium]
MIAAALPQDRLLPLANSLPAAPRILARLNRMLLDMSTGLAEIGTLLRQDSALASRIIRVANSPAFRGAGVGSIEQALQRVGFSEVYRLSGIAAISQLAESQLRCYGYDVRLVSENALLTALACESLAKRSGSEPRSAYTVGLLRSLGKLVLERAAESTPGPDFHDDGGIPVGVWEEQRFGITSAAVGGIVMSHWGFPEAIVAGIRGQYFDRDDAVVHPLACIVNLGGYVAHEHGRGLPGETAAWTPTPLKLASVRIDQRDLQEISDESYTAFVALRTALG